MKSFLSILVAVFLIAVYSTAFASGIQTGLWEIKTETQMEGVNMKIPVHTIQTCIKSDKYIPTEQEKNPNCKTVYTKTEGNTVRWKMVCQENTTKIETTGSMTNMGKSFKSQSETIITEGNTKHVSRSNINGTYLGPCK